MPFDDCFVVQNRPSGSPRNGGDGRNRIGDALEMAKKKPEHLVARSLTIVDEKGKPRVECLALGGSANAVIVRVRDVEGMVRIDLQVNDTDTSVRFASKSGGQAISLLAQDQYRAVFVHDKNGVETAGLSVALRDDGREEIELTLIDWEHGKQLGVTKIVDSPPPPDDDPPPKKPRPRRKRDES